ncbi:hypothetical protein CHS0354_041646 [Potamilus streckersoni]|uniref:Uncharacterized protein n=1 Tax=Potamilus streckersoni TaxID=2493646 RepID=A0AAE0SDJ3_9BIVA|nr:hypothetical protein CHS0354_041646 [Potamilus streckersoni]
MSKLILLLLFASTVAILIASTQGVLHPPPPPPHHPPHPKCICRKHCLKFEVPVGKCCKPKDKYCHKVKCCPKKPHHRG